MSDRFIAVFHEWFMDEGHFTVEPIIAPTLLDAEYKAQSLAYKKDRAFNYCAVHVLEIGNDEHLVRRRLTWKERITGFALPPKITGGE